MKVQPFKQNKKFASSNCTFLGNIILQENKGVGWVYIPSCKDETFPFVKITSILDNKTGNINRNMVYQLNDNIYVPKSCQLAEELIDLSEGGSYPFTILACNEDIDDSKAGFLSRKVWPKSVIALSDRFFKDTESFHILNSKSVCSSDILAVGALEQYVTRNDIALSREEHDDKKVATFQRATISFVNQTNSDDQDVPDDGESIIFDDNDPNEAPLFNKLNFALQFTFPSKGRSWKQYLYDLHIKIFDDNDPHDNHHVKTVGASPSNLPRVKDLAVDNETDLLALVEEKLHHCLDHFQKNVFTISTFMDEIQQRLNTNTYAPSMYCKGAGKFNMFENRIYVNPKISKTIEQVKKDLMMAKEKKCKSNMFEYLKYDQSN